MAEDGIKEPSEEDIRRYDRRRGGKKVSNGDWESPSDPESRIAKLKDGRTHLGYKAVHTVDVSSGVVVAAEVKAAEGATRTLWWVSWRRPRRTFWRWARSRRSGRWWPTRAATSPR